LNHEKSPISSANHRLDEEVPRTLIHNHQVHYGLPCPVNDLPAEEVNYPLSRKKNGDGQRAKFNSKFKIFRHLSFYDTGVFFPPKFSFAISRFRVLLFVVRISYTSTFITSFLGAGVQVASHSFSALLCVGLICWADWWGLRIILLMCFCFYIGRGCVVMAIVFRLRLGCVDGGRLG
jgi:hypothetical protein